MKLRMIGRGSAFNIELGNNNAYIQHDNNVLLIDCGSTTFNRLLTSGFLDRVDNLSVLITHFHPDHVGSLGDLVFYMYYIKKQKISIMFPHADKVITYLEAVGINQDLYNVYQLDNKLTFKFDDTYLIEITPQETQHVNNLKCYGYFFKDENKHFYYSGDSNMIPDNVLNMLFEGKLDRLYQDTCVADYDGNVHLSLRKLCELIPKEHREKVWCMHYDKGFSIGDAIRQ